MGVMIVHHSVRDYAAWRPAYDAHDTARRAAGLTNGRVFRSAEDPNDILIWLLAGSGVVMGTSRHQGGDKGSEQGFAAAAGVVHELEESEVERQLVLRDAPVRA